MQPTETDPELIPRCFWEHLDKTPNCTVLLMTIADYLQDHEDEVGAECLKWALDKGRFPDEGCWASERAFSGSMDYRILPLKLYRSIDHLSAANWKFTGSEGWKRLVLRWTYCTEEERAEFWKWTPPEPTT